jgi:hypothetical protein
MFRGRMKTPGKRQIFAVLVTLSLIGVFSASASAQEETYTGTVYSMNGGARSTGFTLRIRGYTSDEEALRYLTILAEDDQDGMLKAIKNNELGRLSSTGSTGRDLIVVRKTQLPDGKIRLVAAFERWPTMLEVRGGYRSLDYPFGIMELILDANGKKGSGTFIAACKVDMKRDKKTGKYQLELENFGTYPHKVMGVRRR